MENVNKLAKKVLSALDEEDHQAGREPNWTRNLGRLNSIVNSQVQGGKNDISAYEAVFGMPFEGRMALGNPESLQECETIEQRMGLMNERS